MEILEDVLDVDSIIVPFGGLFAEIASAAKARKSDVRMFASEVETAPL